MDAQADLIRIYPDGARMVHFPRGLDYVSCDVCENDGNDGGFFLIGTPLGSVCRKCADENDDIQERYG